MDERSDFGHLEHSRLAAATAASLYGPSAAGAAAAVNSPLMQLPSLADTAGRLGIMDGYTSLNTPFGCPPGGLHDFPGGAISAISSLAQYRGWYGPGVQGQGAPFPEMFGSYAGPGSNWRNLSTPPAPDHFHSPLPGMTHPIWPYQPTPVSCTDGCSLPYYNSSSIFSAYSAYFSMMSGSGLAAAAAAAAASEYPSLLSPRLPGPNPLYQQRLHDMHKALMLTSSARNHAMPEYPLPWNPYMNSSSATALSSPSHLGTAGQLAFKFGSDTGSTSNRCPNDEQRQNIKNEPLHNKTKIRDAHIDHKPRDIRRDQHRSWDHSSVSKQEVLQELKPGTGMSSKVLMKDELLHCRSVSENSLDLCNNNNKKQICGNSLNNSVGPNSDSQSTNPQPVSKAVEVNTTDAVDFKPNIMNLKHPDLSELDSGNFIKHCKGNDCSQEVVGWNRQAVNTVDVTTNASCLLPQSDLKIKNISEFCPVTINTTSCLNSAALDASCDAKVSWANKEQGKPTGLLTVTESKRLIESAKTEDEADTALASEQNVMPNTEFCNSKSQGPKSDDLNFSSVNPTDLMTAENNSCIMQHSMFFEEISNDGMDVTEGNDEESQVAESDGRSLESNFHVGLLSKVSDENGQKNTFSPVLESRNLSASPMRMSSSSSDIAVLSQNSVKLVPSLKNDVQNFLSQSTAVTLYMDESIKFPKTTKSAVSDGSSCLNSQEIDLAIPHHAMRYQVSHQRHNPVQDGCKVHAPTFLPEVCTLPCNAITTVTMSSSAGSSSTYLRLSSSGKSSDSTMAASKNGCGQRSNRTSTKSQFSLSNGANLLIKAEKTSKSVIDFISASDAKEIVISEASNVITSASSHANVRSHMSNTVASNPDRSQSVLQTDLNMLNTWNSSFSSGSYSSVLQPNFLSCLSSCAGQDSLSPQTHDFAKCSSSFSVASLNIASVPSKCILGSHVETRDLSGMPCGLQHCVSSSNIIRLCEDSPSSSSSSPSLVTPSQNLDSIECRSVSDLSVLNEGDIPENLSTKPTLSETETQKIRPVKSVLLSNLSRDGQGCRLQSSCQDGSSVNNIPVGIARALQRTIPQPPTSSCSVDDAANNTGSITSGYHASVQTSFGIKTSKMKVENTITPLPTSSCGGVPPDDHLVGKHSIRSLTPTEGESVGPSSDKQQCWQNDFEVRPSMFSASFNHGWLPATQPTTLPAPINPTALWLGQFPFHSATLLPYSSASVERNPSQHLLHPAGGYKLAQDSITGQIFLVPVPEMSWPNFGSHLFQDSSLQHPSKDKESTVSTNNNCPPSTVHTKPEDLLGADAVSTADSGRLSNSVPTSQQSDLMSSCSMPKIDHHPILEAATDINPLSQYPVVYPATRPQYFVCDPNLFVHESLRQKERVRVNVESRGTSPIQRSLDLDHLDGPSVPEDDAGSEKGKTKLEPDLEKTKLNASVQTSQSSSPVNQEKTFTAEISIQTSDISDSEFDSDGFNVDIKPKFSKFKRHIRALKSVNASKVSDEMNLKTSLNDHKKVNSGKVKDTALSDISGDEVDDVSEKADSLTDTEKAEFPSVLKSTEQKNSKMHSAKINASDTCSKILQHSNPLNQQEDRHLSGKDDIKSNVSDLVECLASNLSDDTVCCSDPDELSRSISQTSQSQDMDALVLLSVIASSQLPAMASEMLQRNNNAGECSNSSVKRFNILDLPITQLIEAERSPDVSTSYNVPKSHFFDEKQFSLESKEYLNPQSNEEPKLDNLTPGILKSDEGPENMDPMELDLRMKMAEVQLKYKQKQKELARLQRKSNELRNNNSKRKKSKILSRQNVQKKSLKKVPTVSDNSTDSAVSDVEEDKREPNLKSRNDIKFTASLHTVSNLTDESNGLKTKVSNSDRKTSLASSFSASTQQQKLSASSKKEYQNSDASDFGEKEPSDSLRVNQIVQANEIERFDGIKTVKSKTKSRECDDTNVEINGKVSEMRKQSKPEQPKKINNVTEDIPLKKKAKQFCFYSYKKNKLSSTGLGKDINKLKLRIAESKNSAKEKKSANSENENRKLVDNVWYRRRSERIFLHEASVGSVASPPASSSHANGLGDLSTPTSPTKARSLSQESQPKNLSSHQKSELSVTLKMCPSHNVDNSSSKKYSVLSDSSGTKSDTDDEPLSTFIHKEDATDIKSCIINKDNLVDGLRVLYLKDGLFYEGTVKAILAPDVYGIIIDGERSSRPQIMSQEELLEKAILNVRPRSRKDLLEGTKICAYWSQKFSCLYPGTVKVLGDSFDDNVKDMVNVEFDDGDTGRIPLAHISMLPRGYESQTHEMSSAMMLVNRKRRNTSDNTCPPDQLPQPSQVSRSLSVGESSGKLSTLDLLSGDSRDMCKVTVKHNMSGKSKSNGKPESHRPVSQEYKGKKEKQEYSCQIVNDKTPSQDGADAVRICEKDNQRVNSAESSVTSQNKSHLTLTIKRKLSHESESSSSDDEDKTEDSSSDIEIPKSRKCHMKRRKVMKLERLDSRSVSEVDEMQTADTLRKNNQKRKRRSSHKSTKNKKLNRSSSSDSDDQIGAFRPVWEQWQWHGPSTRRPGMKGRAKKVFYRAIQRGDEILKIGDAAVFVSTGHNDLQYVGCIDSLWESWDGNMVVKVKWYYHPEETKGGKRLLEIKSALYQSSHEDENDVQTVSHKCTVLSYRDFKKFQSKKLSVNCRPEDVFYLAGTYDPTVSMITYEPDVPLNSH